MKSIITHRIFLLVLLLSLSMHSVSAKSSAVACYYLYEEELIGGSYQNPPDDEFCTGDQLRFYINNTNQTSNFGNKVIRYVIYDANQIEVATSGWMTCYTIPCYYLYTVNLPVGNYCMNVMQVEDYNHDGVPDAGYTEYELGCPANPNALVYCFSVSHYPVNSLSIASVDCNTYTICFNSAISSSFPDPFQDVVIDFGDNTPSETVFSSPICHTFPGPGLYLVTQTITNYCGASTLSVPVTVYPPLTVSLPSQFVCENAQYTPVATISDGTPPYTYLWNNGSTSSSPTYTLNQGNNTISVTVTDANGCTGSATAVVQFAEECCKGITVQSIELTINQPSLQAFVSTHPTLFTTVSIAGVTFTAFNQTVVPVNSTIAFNGSVNIDLNFLIEDYQDIRISNNGSLNILPTCRLRIDNSVIGPCEDMWNGILHTSSTAWLTIRNNSKLWGALGAVQASNSAPFELLNSNFEDNFRSLIVQSCGANYNGVVSGCNFTCAVNGLLPPHTGETSDLGILASNVRGWIIGDYVNYNTFSNLKSGIVNNISVVTIQGNTFNDIRASYYSGGVSQAWHGCATYAIGSTNFFNTAIHTVRTYNTQTPPATSPTFVNCDFGVSTSRTVATVEQNVMNNVTSGVKVGNNLLLGAYVRRNIISSSRYGIQAASFFGGDIQITDNVVTSLIPFPTTIGTTQFFGIRVDNAAAVATGQPIDNISRNHVSFGHNGIFLTSLVRPTIIEDNTVLMQDNPAWPGNLNAINVENCTGITISQNNTDCTDPARHRGIRLIRSTDYTLNCNNTENSRIGLLFVTHCQTALKNIYENRMANNFYGLQLDRIGSALGFIGTTVGDIALSNNNKFIDPFGSGFDTYNRTMAGGGWAVPKIWNNPNSINFQYRNDPNVSIPPGYEILMSQTATSAVESNTCNMPGGLSNPPDPEQWMLDLAEGNITFENFPEGTEWFSEKDLYAVLDEEEALRQASTSLVDFYNTKQPAAIGKLREVSNLLSGELDTTGYSDPAVIEAKIDEIEELNDEVPDENVFAVNEKFVNTISAQVLRHGLESLAAAQLSELAALSAQCPYLAGEAVYKARAIYAWFNPDLYFDGKLLCFEQNYYKTDADAADEFAEPVKGLSSILSPTDNISILGNPANEQLTLLTDFKQPAAIIIKLINPLGQTILQENKTVSRETVAIPVGQLPAGAYLLSITSTNGFSFAKPIAVIS